MKQLTLNILTIICFLQANAQEQKPKDLRESMKIISHYVDSTQSVIRYLDTIGSIVKKIVKNSSPTRIDKKQMHKTYIFAFVHNELIVGCYLVRFHKKKQEVGYGAYSKILLLNLLKDSYRLPKIKFFLNIIRTNKLTVINKEGFFVYKLPQYDSSYWGVFLSIFLQMICFFAMLKATLFSCVSVYEKTPRYFLHTTSISWLFSGKNVRTT